VLSLISMCFLIYALCFNLNGRKKITYSAVIFAFLLFCLPILQKQVFWTHPDLPMTACLLCVLYAAKNLNVFAKKQIHLGFFAFCTATLSIKFSAILFVPLVACFLFSNRHLFEVAKEKNIQPLYHWAKIMGTGAAVLLPLYFLFNPYMLFAPYKLTYALEYERVSQITNHYSYVDVNLAAKVADFEQNYTSIPVLLILGALGILRLLFVKRQALKASAPAIFVMIFCSLLCLVFLFNVNKTSNGAHYFLTPMILFLFSTATLFRLRLTRPSLEKFFTLSLLALVVYSFQFNSSVSATQIKSFASNVDHIEESINETTRFVEDNIANPTGKTIAISAYHSFDYSKVGFKLADMYTIWSFPDYFFKALDYALIAKSDKIFAANISGRSDPSAERIRYLRSQFKMIMSDKNEDWSLCSENEKLFLFCKKIKPIE
jgi:hypothetical protein